MNTNIISALTLIGLLALACQAEPEEYQIVSASSESAIEEAYFNDCKPETRLCPNCCTECCRERDYTSGEQTWDVEDQSTVCHCTRYPIPFVPEIGEVYPTDHTIIDMSGFDRV